MTKIEFNNLIETLVRDAKAEREATTVILSRFIKVRKSYKEYLKMIDGKPFIKCSISNLLMPATTEYFREVKRGIPVGDKYLSYKSIPATKIKKEFTRYKKRKTLEIVQNGVDIEAKLDALAKETPNYSQACLDYNKDEVC